MRRVIVFPPLSPSRLVLRAHRMLDEKDGVPVQQTLGNKRAVQLAS